MQRMIWGDMVKKGRSMSVCSWSWSSVSYLHLIFIFERQELHFCLLCCAYIAWRLWEIMTFRDVARALSSVRASRCCCSTEREQNSLQKVHGWMSKPSCCSFFQKWMPCFVCQWLCFQNKALYKITYGFLCEEGNTQWKVPNQVEEDNFPCWC